MIQPQTGIFALGDAAHTYLEFDRRPGVPAAELVAAVAGLHEPHTTVGGVNLVVGVRPEVWREAAPQDAPEGAHGFDAPVAGAGGYTIPGTQHDLWLWLAGASYDHLFDTATAVTEALAPVAALAQEHVGWAYRRNRDLTGFEDGTENPDLIEAPSVALVPDGRPGTGASIVLFQRWQHHRDTFLRLPVEEQERVIGRTKPESVELEPLPPSSHTARTVIEEDGEELAIFRRSVPYGNVGEHGLLFVGFSCEQRRLQLMLERMAGAGDGVRDALTHYSTPHTGGYYVVPAAPALRRFAAAAPG